MMKTAMENLLIRRRRHHQVYESVSTCNQSFPSCVCLSVCMSTPGWHGHSVSASWLCLFDRYKRWNPLWIYCGSVSEIGDNIIGLWPPASIVITIAERIVGDTLVLYLSYRTKEWECQRILSRVGSSGTIILSHDILRNLVLHMTVITAITLRLHEILLWDVDDDTCRWSSAWKFFGLLSSTLFAQIIDRRSPLLWQKVSGKICGAAFSPPFSLFITKTYWLSFCSRSSKIIKNTFSRSFRHIWLDNITWPLEPPSQSLLLSQVAWHNLYTTPFQSLSPSQCLSLYHSLSPVSVSSLPLPLSFLPLSPFAPFSEGGRRKDLRPKRHNNSVHRERLQVRGNGGGKCGGRAKERESWCSLELVFIKHTIIPQTHYNFHPLPRVVKLSKHMHTSYHTQRDSTRR